MSLAMADMTSLVERSIGPTRFLVDPHAPVAIYFQKNSDCEGDDFRNLAGFVEWARAGIRVPGIVQWELLSACNFRCPFCYIVGHSPTQIFNAKRALELTSELAEAGTVHVILTGGEPLLHPKFAEIYRSLKNAGILVSIYTNLALLSADILRLFEEFPPYGIEVSIYGKDEDTYQRATGQNAFHQVLANIDLLRTLGTDVLCKTPVTSLTQESVTWIRAWCTERNLPYVITPNIEDGLDGADLSSFALTGHAFYSIERIRAGTLPQAPQNSVKAKSSNSTSGGRDPHIAFGCGVAKVGAYIGYNGVLSPCARTRDRSYNVLNQSFVQAWWELVGDVIPEEGQTIRGCDLLCRAKSICKMCPALALRDEHGHYRVDPNYCNKRIALWDELHSK